MAAEDIVLAMTGASGTPYALRLLEVLMQDGRNVHLTMSAAAVEVLHQETERRVIPGEFDLSQLLDGAEGFPGQVHYHDYRDFFAGIASGSFLTAGMVICPCSGGTASAVANGLSQNLIHRAADVHLKEKRRLIVVPRETPLSVIQLKNFTTLAEAGAIVLPASPAFYTRPATLQDCIDFIVARICDQLHVAHQLVRRWSE